MASTVVSMDEELEEMMAAAGFTKERLKFHHALCDFYELQYKNKVYAICGSFAEGWGCNTSLMSGLVSDDSDVDMSFFFNSSIHFSDCSCSDIESNVKTVRDIGEGHCTLVKGSFPSVSPAHAYERTSLLANMDSCLAYTCSCLPSSCTLFSQQRKLPQNLLDKCRQVGVHLVNAQRPGKEMSISFKFNEEMRISYSLMERILVRSFPENIGRAFILVKFLFKRLLPKEFGLKSYMAKTLMFYMMEEEVEASSTIEVALRALRLLINFLTSYQPERREVCLPHFFQDAPIFFKKPKKGEGGDWPDKQKIFQRMQEEVIDRLEETVRKFKDQLGVAPNVYFCQSSSLLCLGMFHIGRFLSNFDSESALEQIRSLPEHWRTTRAVFECLWSLRRGKREEAVSVLAGAPDDEELTVIDGDEESLHRHFSSNVSQWIFRIVKDYHLKLLPVISRHFYNDSHGGRVVSLKAMLNLLRLHLCGGDHFSEEKWHHQLQKSFFPDFQEIFFFAIACKRLEFFEWARKKLQSLAIGDADQKLVENVDEHRQRQNSKMSWLNDEVMKSRLSDCGVDAVDYFVLLDFTRLNSNQHLWLANISEGLSDYSTNFASHDGYEFLLKTKFTQNSIRLHLYLIWIFEADWPCETEFVIEVVNLSNPKETSPVCARVQRKSAHPMDKNKFIVTTFTLCVNEHSNFVELTNEDLASYSIYNSILVRVTTNDFNSD